jgi:hypothetical protein
MVDGFVSDSEVAFVVSEYLRQEGFERTLGAFRDEAEQHLSSVTAVRGFERSSSYPFPVNVECPCSTLVGTPWAQFGLHPRRIRQDEALSGSASGGHVRGVQRQSQSRQFGRAHTEIRNVAAG